VEIMDTVFNKKFQFYNNKVAILIIDNCNFYGLIDCYQTKFSSFNMHKSICENYAGFEQCEFGSNLKNKDHLTMFKYVTFKDIFNARDAKFNSGLDMKSINLLGEANFLDAKIDPKNTNRETFRIIKHSFEKIGNQIEANKYFAKEMNKYAEDIKGTKAYSTRFLLCVNRIVSDFGQSYIKPLAWMIFLAFTYMLINHILDIKLITTEYQFLENAYDKTGNFLNNFATSFTPFKKLLGRERQFLNLIFGVAFSGLIYQFIVAVKRVTKK
jgi:hypothetical protein